LVLNSVLFIQVKYETVETATASAINDAKLRLLNEQIDLARKQKDGQIIDNKIKRLTLVKLENEVGYRVADDEDLSISLSD
jgi:hypothetical protein